MNNVQFAAQQAEAAGHTYAIFLRHVEADLTLPEGVTVELVDSRACGCRSDECFFCVAIDDAVWSLAYEEELAEWSQKYGGEDADWHVCTPECPEWEA